MVIDSNLYYDGLVNCVILAPLAENLSTGGIIFLVLGAFLYNWWIYLWNKAKMVRV